MNSKIIHITATQVFVHAKEGYVDRPAFGPSIFDKGQKWMIEMRTDSGLIGYGETPRHTGLGDVQSCAQQLVGKQLKDIPWARPVPTDYTSNDMFGHLDPPVPHRLYERDMGGSGGSVGIEIAAQDLIAKAAGLRLCDLFGGAHRQWVATDWWMGRSDPEHAAKHMAIGLKLGYNSIKMKAAGEDDIVGTVRAIKQTAGEHTRIVIDPNRRFYRCCEAIKIAHQLEDAGFDNIVFEDPFPFDINEWQLFRQKTSIPLTHHCTTATHIALANRCCDYVNLVYPASKFLGDAHMAAQFDILCWAGSGVDLGILNAYMLHYSAAARNCVLPGDAFGHDIRVHGLVNEPFTTQDGKTKLPDGLGLGVSIDHDAMKQFAKETWELSA